jgi:KilA-N domain
MPSFRQYWSTMPNTTRHHYIKTHRDFSVFKRYIITHARNNNVTITEDVGDASFDSFRAKKRTLNTQSISQPSPKRLRKSGPPSPLLPIEEPQAAVIDPQELHIEEPQLLTQIEELQAAAVDSPPAIDINGARKPLVLNGITIEVDPQTLMVNATQMCRAAGKLFGHYRRLDSTEEFLQELSSVIHIRITGLIYTIQGGRPELQGTWVDWRVALHLAQWLSPAVQVQVTGWIGELRIENDQLLTQIEELQTAAAISPHANAINGARKPLVLNGITIEVDPQTLMVNATQMCKAGGKLFGDYHRNKCYKDFENELSEAMGIPIANLTKCENGNREGTMVHRRIALFLAQKISPLFAVQVTGWLEELFMTGRVELGNEMSPQQLDEAWQQRVIDAQRLQKDAEDRLAGAIEETRKELIAKASEERELAVQKTREELMATVQALVRDTEQLPQFPDGANVLYAAYIDNGLIKYGQSSNFIRRLADHQRHYPEFLLIKALLCDNAVAAEKKLRDFVAKKRIGAEFRGEKEIIGFKTQEDIYLLIKAMQKSCRNRSSDNAVELKRIEANVTIQLKKMELLMQDKITFDQYLLMK